MRYLSVCSGIEAASVAFGPLGWKPLAFSEIEAFPRAVLKHHYPEVPLHGDFTRLRDEPWIVDADLLVGGTPCQAFSVAGLRRSLDDDRGNLSLEFIRLADAIDDLRRDAGRPPAWVCWENVPGVLSTHDNAFGAFLGGLVGSESAIDPPFGRSWRDAGVVAGPRRVAAWRVLDAQYFGVAQRRRRVFVLALGGAGRWACADALLPIADSLSGHPPPSREAGKRVAPTIAARTRGGGGLGTDFDCDGGLIPYRMQAFGEYESDGTASSMKAREDGTGRGTPLVPIAIQERAVCENPLAGPDGAGIRTDGVAYTLEARIQQQAVAFTARDYKQGAFGECQQARPLTTSADRTRADPIITAPMAVRRITPREAERLQGFPDDWTLVPYRGKPAEQCPDGPRYKALGNSMAVPCMAFIGERIAAIEALRVEADDAAA